MNTKIELHDSKIAGISEQASTVVVHFLPAHLHKSKGRPGFDSGTIWVQEARLIFIEASVSGKFPDWPCNLMDGELFLGGELHANSIPVPVEVSKTAQLRMICDSIHTVTVTGRGVRLELVGKPRYIEEFKSRHLAA